MEHQYQINQLGQLIYCDFIFSINMSSENDSTAAIKRVPSKWNTHYFTGDISETIYSFRVLKMNQSLFIYIGQADNEVFDELAVAIPVADNVSTTIIGSQINCDSQELAQQFTKRLKKQVFISCNVLTNGLIRPLLVKRISEEIKNFPDAF